MKIELKNITVKDLFDGFINTEENGVFGYGGKLNIRPKYQREFVYDEKQRKAVIETIRKGFPLNVMYWVQNEDDTYELLDGQQRTLSICSYLDGSFFVDWDGTLRSASNLTTDQRKVIDDYELMIYVCSKGSDSEKLEWFKTINIAGEKLTDQEIRNAIYSGTWVTEAKKKFSKTGCVASKLASEYLTGSSIRQDYLETAIDWHSQISDPNTTKRSDRIERYMASHQKDANADDLWLYFQNVIQWVKLKFPKKRKEMKCVPWGELYNRYKDKNLDAIALEERVTELMCDSDVQKKSGIYIYVLNGDEHALGIRSFDANTKRTVYEKQKRHCANPNCPKGSDFEFPIEEMEADHITPWSKGGHTVIGNCQMLCRDCNRRKSGK